MIRAILILLLLIGLVGVGQATDIEGPLWGILPLAHSPYYAIDTVYVPQFLSLIIEPGVEIYFDELCSFHVYEGARLTAIGTPQDSILFTAADPSAKWAGLKFIIAHDSSELRYCHISYGDNVNTPSVLSDGGGIDIYYTDMLVQNCLIDCCAASSGGGIALDGGSTSIVGCTIRNNWAVNRGAGIWANSYNTISRNHIHGNSLQSSSGDGGGIFAREYAIIAGNIIHNNAADDGGGIAAEYFFGSITGNLLMNNTAYHGGGISIPGGAVTHNVVLNNIAQNGGGIVGGSEISHNIVKDNIATGGYFGSYAGGIQITTGGIDLDSNLVIGNSADAEGGGIHCNGYDFSMRYNLICGNSASIGGGLYIWNQVVSDISHCTLAYNQAEQGAGIYTWLSVLSVSHSIIWGNSQDGILYFPGGQPNTIYSNTQVILPGDGNISENPRFITPDPWNYQLRWGSPCIDSGNPLYMSDPDGTITDMGADYYNQALPVNVVIASPDIVPVILEGGGSFDLCIYVTNKDTLAHEVDLWIDIMLPDSTLTEPVLGPVSFTISPEIMIDREGIQSVPAGAPYGIYKYRLHYRVEADSALSQLTFVKAPVDTNLVTVLSWANTIESFDDIPGLDHAEVPDEHFLSQCYPNPFNPATVISYRLQAASSVNLAVYDITGRKVAGLVDGWRDAGLHEVSFDGSGLASGIYIYRISARDFTASKKMVLLK